MLYLIKIKRGVIMQAFIFDMDGVIIDSEPIHNKVVKEVLLENNIVVDDEEFNKLIGMTSTSVFSYFIDKHHLPYTPEEMTNNHMNFFKKYTQGMELVSYLILLPVPISVNILLPIPLYTTDGFFAVPQIIFVQSEYCWLRLI